MTRQMLSERGLLLLRHWSLMLAVAAVFLVSPAAEVQGATFPAAGWDSFPSTGVFRVVLSPTYGGGEYTIWVTDPNTYVLRSAAHVEGGAVDTIGAVVGNGTAPSPVVIDPDTVSDQSIGTHPADYETGPPRREVHTKIAWMSWGILTAGCCGPVMRHRDAVGA